jgi:MFS family permease
MLCLTTKFTKEISMNHKLIFAYLTGLSLGMTFLNLPPGLNCLMDLYHVSYTGISLLMSAILWSHALMQVPSGLIADRIGIGRTLIMGTGFLAFGNLIPAGFPTLNTAIIGRFVSGFGTGLCFVTSMKLIAFNAPEGRIGSFQAFFAGAFSFGNILAYLLIPKLLPFGWQWIYLMPGIFGFALFLFSFSLGALPGSSPTLPPLRRILRIRAGWVLGCYHALSWGAILSLGNWIPSLLAEFWPHSTAAQLAWGGAIVMFISGAGRISGGFILYRFTPMFTANTSILILFLLFLGLFIIPVPGVLLALAFLAAWFSCINFGAFFHLASSATEPANLATLLGFVNFLANLGAVLFTLVFGFAKDATGSLKWGFGLMMILSLVVFVVGRGVLKKECSSDSCSPDFREY